MVDTYRYPENIGSDEYNNRQIVFKCAKKPTRRNRGEWSEDIENKIQSGKSFFADLKNYMDTTSKTLVESSSTLDLGSWGSGITSIASNTISALSGAKDENPNLQDEKTETLCGIMLPLPNQITDNASHKWEITKSLLGQLSDAALGNDAINKAYQALNYMAMRSQGKQYSVDPAYWQLYKGSEPRKFSLNYEFVPESHSEAENIIKIISLFKAYSSPRLQSNDVILESPYFWSVEIANNTISNLISMDNVTITEVQVTYGADGAMSMFYDGMPKQINLTLSLQETQPPYRNDPTPAVEKSHTNPTRQKSAEEVKRNGNNGYGSPDKSLTKDTKDNTGNESVSGTNATVDALTGASVSNRDWKWYKPTKNIVDDTVGNKTPDWKSSNKLDLSQLPTGK